MSGASFCWECGGPLNKKNGELRFEEILPPGSDQKVRVHVECKKNYRQPAPDYAQQGVRQAVHNYLGGEEK